MEQVPINPIIQLQSRNQRRRSLRIRLARRFVSFVFVFRPLIVNFIFCSCGHRYKNIINEKLMLLIFNAIFVVLIVIRDTVEARFASHPYFQIQKYHNLSKTDLFATRGIIIFFNPKLSFPFTFQFADIFLFVSDFDSDNKVLKT